MPHRSPRSPSRPARRALRPGASRAAVRSGARSHRQRHRSCRAGSQARQVCAARASDARPADSAPSQRDASSPVRAPGTPGARPTRPRTPSPTRGCVRTRPDRASPPHHRQPSRDAAHGPPATPDDHPAAGATAPARHGRCAPPARRDPGQPRRSRQGTHQRLELLTTRSEPIRHSQLPTLTAWVTVRSDCTITTTAPERQDFTHRRVNFTSTGVEIGGHVRPPPWSTKDINNADFDTLFMTPRPRPAAHRSPAEPLNTPPEAAVNRPTPPISAPPRRLTPASSADKTETSRIYQGFTASSDRPEVPSEEPRQYSSDG